MSGNEAVKCSRWVACVRQLCAGLSAASGQQGALLCLHTHTGSHWRARATGKGDKSSYDLLVHRSLPPEEKSLLYGIW